MHVIEHEDDPPFWTPIIIKLIATALFRAPIQSLRRIITEKDWFKGIVVSTAFFELFGLLILQEKFKGEIERKKFDRLGLEEIIMFLYGSNVIDQTTYTKMMRIKKMRNKLVHSPLEYHSIDPKEAKRLVEDAIDCLKALGLPE